MNNKIIITIGIPASGKSTWAKDYVRNNPSWIRISRDDFRQMLKTAQMCEPKIEDLVTTLVNKTIEQSLAKKLNVIIDNTNVNVKYINGFIDKFKYSADIDYRVFDISLKKAIERDNNREMKVGEDVIKRMYKQYVDLIDSFNFQPVKQQKRPHLKVNYDSMLPHAVAFDIDGTLALMGNRSPYDWNKVDNDDINHIVAEQIKFHKSKERVIILLSGRDESCKKLTEEWCEYYGIEYDMLLMRKKDDMRKDTIVKRELYNDNIKGIYNLLAIYDDRLSVVDMWFNEGIFTFNVNQGNIEF